VNVSKKASLMKIENKSDGSVIITLSKSLAVKFSVDLYEISRHFDLESFFGDSDNSLMSMYELLTLDCDIGVFPIGEGLDYPEDEIPQRE